MRSPPTAATVPVLIVDDNEADLRLLREALADGPVAYEIHTARDGREAFDLLRSRAPPFEGRRPAFILIDLNMPGMNGREFLQRLRADRELGALPVVLMTSSPLEREAELASGSGASDCFRKPSSYTELRTLLRQFDRFTVAAPPTGRR